MINLINGIYILGLFYGVIYAKKLRQFELRFKLKLSAGLTV